MATIAKWEDSLAEMTEKELGEIDSALDTLSKWSLFETEYGEMRVIRAIVASHLIYRIIYNAKKERVESIR